MNKKCNILLVDDHQIVLDGIQSMLAGNKGFRIIAEANDGQAALNLILNSSTVINLVIADISMPLLTGIELCKMIKEQRPEIKVLMLSMYSSTAAVKEAVTAEADGFILKSSGKEELLKALHRITDEGTYFSQSILPILYQQYKKEEEHNKNLSILTDREQQVLQLILDEFTSEEIAQKLFISKKTVDNHRQNLLSKTGCKSTIGLVKFAIKNGFYN